MRIAAVKGTVGILLDAFRQKHLTLSDFELLMHTLKT